MTDLHDILQAHVGNGSVPGAVALVARGGLAPARSNCQRSRETE